MVFVIDNAAKFVFLFYWQQLIIFLCLLTSGYAPIGLRDSGVREVDPSFLILVLKVKEREYFFRGEGSFFLGTISLGRMVVPPPPLIVKTYEKLHCNEKSS